MQVKITQSFIADGVTVPPGALLTMPEAAAREYISGGLTVPVPVPAKRERAIRNRAEKAVTQPDA